MTTEELFSSKSKLTRWWDGPGWLLWSRSQSEDLRQGWRSTGHSRLGEDSGLSCPCCSVLCWQLLPQCSLAACGPLRFTVCLQGDEMAQGWSIWAPSCPCCHLLNGLRHTGFIRESLAKMPRGDWNGQRLKRQMPGRSLSTNHHHRNNQKLLDPFSASGSVIHTLFTMILRGRRYYYRPSIDKERRTWKGYVTWPRSHSTRQSGSLTRAIWLEPRLRGTALGGEEELGTQMSGDVGVGSRVGNRCRQKATDVRKGIGFDILCILCIYL